MCPLFYLMGFWFFGFFWSLFPHPAICLLRCRICLPVCSRGLDLRAAACSLRERYWGLNWVQCGRGSIEGVGEPSEERAQERVWWSVRAPCPRQPGGGGGTGRLPLAAPPSLCQQVESVIAVPGEGVRARTPITNHRLPPLGSWSRIVFLEGKHLNPSELSKSIHDSETLPSPFGIVCVPGSELLLMYLLLCSFKISSFLYAVWGEKGLLLERRFQKWFRILSQWF